MLIQWGSHMNGITKEHIAVQFKHCVSGNALKSEYMWIVLPNA